MYICDNCGYLFDEPDVIRCPDCGYRNIRTAEPQEIEEFEKLKKDAEKPGT